MLFVSKDKKRFITCTEEGAPCFTRPSHVSIANQKGLDLAKMDNITAGFYYTNKKTRGGVSITNFLNNSVTLQG